MGPAQCRRGKQLEPPEQLVRFFRSFLLEHVIDGDHANRRERHPNQRSDKNECNCSDPSLDHDWVEAARPSLGHLRLGDRGSR